MNTTQAEIQRIQTRLQALGQTNRRVVTPPPSPAPQPSISLPTYRSGGDRPVNYPVSSQGSNSGSNSTAHYSSPSHLSPHDSSPGLFSPPTPPQASKPSSPAMPEQVQPQPPSQPTSKPSHSESFSESIDAAFHLLDVQVQQVNSMSQALETALQDAAIIAQHLNQQRAQAAIRGQKTQLDHLESPLVYDPQHIHPEQSCLPQINRNDRGEFVLTGRPLAWRGGAQTPSSSVTRAKPAHLQQEAGAIATHLRHQRATRASQSSLKPQSLRHQSLRHQSLRHQIMRWFNPSHVRPSHVRPSHLHPSHSVASPAFAADSSHAAASPDTFVPSSSTINGATVQPASQVNPRSNQHQPSRQPQSTSATAPLTATIPRALLFIGGAAIARIGMDHLLVMYPMLWPIVFALVVTPAAIAIYRSTVNPQSSFVLGRCLLLIMMGLLIGGRL
ncbi:MAG: hypothetical protein WBA57_10405 [Elainellaceae cyanobacterium]